MSIFSTLVVSARIEVRVGTRPVIRTATVSSTASPDIVDTDEPEHRSDIRLMAGPVRPNVPTGAESYNPRGACREGWSATSFGRPERPRHGCLEHLRTRRTR